jgi:hypothetical protein
VRGVWTGAGRRYARDALAMAVVVVVAVPAGRLHVTGDGVSLWYPPAAVGLLATVVFGVRMAPDRTMLDAKQRRTGRPDHAAPISA